MCVWFLVDFCDCLVGYCLGEFGDVGLGIVGVDVECV